MIFALDLPSNKDAIVTTRNIAFLVGSHYWPENATVTGWGGVDPRFSQEINFLMLSQAIIS